jgi:hypothetical protein
MFARHLIWKLKPNTITEFNRITDKEIIPLLFKQKGFLEQTYFVAPERLEAISASMWKNKEEAEAYNTTSYPEVLKLLSPVIDGPPTVKTFEFASSTAQKAAAAKM